MNTLSQKYPPQAPGLLQRIHNNFQKLYVDKVLKIDKMNQPENNHNQRTPQ